MIKIKDATPSQQRAYNNAHGKYARKLKEYHAWRAKSLWFRMWNRQLAKRAPAPLLAPGTYLVTNIVYRDGASASDWDTQGHAWSGSWIQVEQRSIMVPEFSPDYYLDLEAAEIAAEQNAYDMQQQAMITQNSLLRMNAGEDYYSLDQPWTWQQNPRGY